MRGSSPIAGLPADRARYFHNDVHQRHAPATEWGGSGLIECAEIPSRVTVIEQALTAAGAQLEVAPPADRRVLQRIHSTGYLDFLENAVRDWTAVGLDLPVLAGTFAPRDFDRIGAEGDPGTRGLLLLRDGIADPRRYVGGCARGGRLRHRGHGSRS